MKYIGEISGCRYRCSKCKVNLSGLGYIFETRIGFYKAFCNKCIKLQLEVRGKPLKQL